MTIKSPPRIYRKSEDYRLLSCRDSIAADKRPHPTLLCNTPPHSHSIISERRNSLSFQGKYFRRMLKYHAPDPSVICALDSKKEFRPSAISSVSETIDIDRSIFDTEVDAPTAGEI